MSVCVHVCYCVMSRWLSKSWFVAAVRTDLHGVFQRKREGEKCVWECVCEAVCVYVRE